MKLSCVTRHAAHHQLLFSSLFAQLKETFALVLRAAAACTIFDRRSQRPHLFQPSKQLLPEMPAQHDFFLSQRALELASLQPWCRDIAQRVLLLCCCCPLSTLASRLSRDDVNRHSMTSIELCSTSRIMKRCFSGFVWRLWIEIDR